MIPGLYPVAVADDFVSMTKASFSSFCLVPSFFFPLAEVTFLVESENCLLICRLEAYHRMIHDIYVLFLCEKIELLPDD